MRAAYYRENIIELTGWRKTPAEVVCGGRPAPALLIYSGQMSAARRVPALQPTVAWTLRAMVADNGASLAQLKAFVQKVGDPRDREELLRAIRQLELVMPGARTGAPDGGTQTVADRATVAAPASTADTGLLADPAAAYTREVKAALIDAMLENSGPLVVAPEEWLTIAARDSEPGNRLVPGDSYDTTTWVLRVKGTDLAAFRAGRLSIEEARKRVEVREF